MNDILSQYVVSRLSHSPKHTEQNTALLFLFIFFFFLGLQCIDDIKRPLQSELSNSGLVVLESQKTVTVCY